MTTTKKDVKPIDNKDKKTELVSDDRGLMIKVEAHIDRVEASINNYTNLLSVLERKLFLNSVLSYVVFFIVATTFSYIVFIERNRSLQNENKLFQTTIEQNDLKIKQLNEEINGYKTTAQKIAVLLEDFSNTTADPKKLVDDYESMNRQFFSKVEELYFQERVNKLKIDLSIKFYENGKNLYQSNSHSKAVVEFLESLKYNPKNPYINEIYFYLGASYLTMKKYSESIPYLEKAMVNTFDSNRRSEILYYLGNAYERLSNIVKAREFYKEVIDKHSRSPRYWDARKRFAEIGNR